VGNPGSDGPVYKKEDGWNYTPSQGWDSPPQPLDLPLDQAPQIGESFQISSPDPLQSTSKDTIAHPQIGLRASFALKAARQAVDESDPNKGYRMVEKDFVVSLQNTHITPRPETTDPESQDGPGHTGWYVDQIDIEMGFDPQPDWIELVSSAPPTGSLSANVDSSVSRTLNVGFFGDQITGSYSQTWTNSFSYSLQDFTTVNNSTNEKLVQRVQMEMSKGAPYQQPNDLIDGSSDSWGCFGGNGQLPLDPPGNLRGLPPKAISRLDLGCQGLWTVTEEGLLPDTKGTVPFYIKITPRFVHFLTRNKLKSEMTDHELFLWDRWNLRCTQGGLTSEFTPFMIFFDIDTATPTFIWRCNVDFSGVGYSKVAAAAQA